MATNPLYQHWMIATWHMQQYQDYSAMRWPCPEGFHIPQSSERVALCWILTTTFWLANNGNTVKTYLKMPFAGTRYNSSSDVCCQGTDGAYWSSTAATSGQRYFLYSTSSSLTPQNADNAARGFSIRCFKDEPVVPDDTWTELYEDPNATWWTAWPSWIYHNITLWLISISWDGETRITIADKNLWATAVYNDWNTLSQTNCGTYFQWGNNYWFAWTGSLTTSNTRVNTTWYWPWNYYSSNTFITISSSPRNWSNVENANLRWWQTWVQNKWRKRV